MDPEEACLSNCELFGKSAEYFDAQVVPLWQGVYEALVSRSRATPGARVLDIGTGTGEVALRMSRVVGPGGTVLGIDTIDEMLTIARRKAGAAGSLKFENMSAEKLSLPDSSFNVVVGNYSLCCFMDYPAALRECLRVLKPGGRMTYNHSGLGDPPQYEKLSEVFEKYQTKAPTEKLAKIRESDELQNDAVEKYRDPAVALALMKGLGYKGPGASLTERIVRYKDSQSFIERMLSFDWRNEAAEINPRELDRFRSEALDALSAFPNGQDFQIRDSMVFFTGLKP